MKRACALLALGPVALAACPHPDEPPHFVDEYYSAASSGRQCAITADRGHAWSHTDLDNSLLHAQNYSVVLHTMARTPTLDLTEYIPDLDWAVTHGVRMVTYRELTTGFRGPGWAFGVTGKSGDEVDTWTGWREQLRLHGVHVTFFVASLETLTPKQHEELQALATDGHDIEAVGSAAPTLFAAENLPPPVAVVDGLYCVMLTP